MGDERSLLFVRILDTSLGRRERLSLVVERDLIGLGHGFGHLDRLLFRRRRRRVLLLRLISTAAAAVDVATSGHNQRFSVRLIQLLVRVLSRHLFVFAATATSCARTAAAATRMHDVVHLEYLVAVGVAATPRGRHLNATRDRDGRDERHRVEETRGDESVERGVERVDVEEPRVELIRLGHVVGHVDGIVDEIVELEVIGRDEIEAERGESEESGERGEYGEEDERTQETIAFAAARASMRTTAARAQAVLVDVGVVVGTVEAVRVVVERVLAFLAAVCARVRDGHVVTTRDEYQRDQAQESELDAAEHAHDREHAIGEHFRRLVCLFH